MRRIFLPAAALVALVASTCPRGAASADDARASGTLAALHPGSLTVEPSRMVLRHPRQPQSLIVSARDAAGFSVDALARASLIVGDARIAAVDAEGWVRPIANGATEIVVTVGDQVVRVSVTVALPAQTPPYSFRHEVMPALSKAGCNLGACHGYSLGKNGFKLSLRGQDPDADWVAITRDALGRRVDFAKPHESLLVAKPLGLVAHQGGVRFQRGSLPDEFLTGWIGQGAGVEPADTNEVVAVRVIPPRLAMAQGDRHRIQLVAQYSDGSTRDVTRLACYSVNNPQHALVDDAGAITAGDFGETAVVARFERKFAAVDVVVLRHVSDFAPTSVPSDHVVDHHVVRKLNELKMQLSPPADDEEFLRRVSLDLIGLQPTPDDVRAFLADADPGKRGRVIERLLQRPEFVDYWSLKWGDLLQNSRNVLSPQAMYLFREWIRGAIASSMPLDEFARRLLTAQGGPDEDPSSAFLAISKDTNDTVERITQVFCGVRLLCARCHSHPLENWTQGDYYGVASFFNQVSTKADPRAPNVANHKMVFVNLSAPVAGNPRTGRLEPPRFLGGEQPQLPHESDRRTAYAQWLTSPQNPYFARGLANRIWSYFFHRGIVDPVDDVRSTNPPINPELLDALTKDLIDHHFEMRHLMRTIVTSRTYQASSQPTTSNELDTQNFSHSMPRRIPAEALLDSLVQATGVRENFGGAPGNFSAAQLPDANVTSDFLALFGKPQRMEACECERDGGSNMLQALHLINGQTILGKVANPSGRVAQLVTQKADDGALVEELYLWALARRPSDKERSVGVEFLKAAGGQRLEAAQDLMWALLNSRDFMLVR